MNRYIDVDELIRKINEYECYSYDSEISRICELINDAPARDVEPVRHGQWVEVKSWESEKHSVTDMRCNLCGKYASLVLPHKTKCTYKYCPFCGAKMDGEGQKHE